MKTKKYLNYGYFALLSVGVLTGVVTSLALQISGSTLNASLFSDTDPDCKMIKEIIDSGAYSESDKSYFIDNCIKKEKQKNAETQMLKNEKEMPWKIPQIDNMDCKNLLFTMEKLVSKGMKGSEQYKQIESAYEERCLSENQECMSLQEQMKKMIEAGEGKTEDYTKLKTEYLSSCHKEQATEKIREQKDKDKKIEKDFSGEKNGGKKMPAAGYEDEVVTATDLENPFSDTSLDSKEGVAAFELYRRGVIGGFKDGTFKGERTVNRAEAAKFLLLARYEQLNDSADGGNEFKDVKKGEWYSGFVNAAAKKGIIKGYQDGTFKPGSTVNTAEFLKMLAVTFELPGNLPHSYSDVKGTDWFNEYAGIAQMYNLFPDRTENILNPSKALTRKEVTIAIYQYLLNR